MKFKDIKYFIGLLSIFSVLIIGCTDENPLTNDDLTEIDKAMTRSSVRLLLRDQVKDRIITGE